MKGLSKVEPLVLSIDVDAQACFRRSSGRRWLKVAALALPLAVAAQWWFATHPKAPLLEVLEALVVFGTGLAGTVIAVAQWRRARAKTPLAPVVVSMQPGRVSLVVGEEVRLEQAPLRAVHLLPGWLSLELASEPADPPRFFDLPLAAHQRDSVASVLPVRRHSWPTLFLYFRIFGLVRQELVVHLLTLVAVFVGGGGALWLLAKAVTWLVRRSG